MQTIRIAIAAAACALLSAAAHASPELAASKACMACHSVDKRLVGPAFKDVAAKYKGSKDAAAQLSGSILKGSSGKWGPVPMPANRVTDAEADTLAKWVLTL
ncbi:MULTISPECIES: c-type cytochrome [Cupriavidus]|uniref:Cytochrome c, class I n=1 Tax=Cupriavidus pinatubonensis (strain JMP 134 / LMG 1197) TaxID=264198 RepID=Q46R75_CUPPJ|nr:MULTISPECIES: c-type cytochrome [Cupriavidus]QYY27989.1 c-type cytochrome [Cupriavidus pinatubonensis]